MCGDTRVFITELKVKLLNLVNNIDKNEYYQITYPVSMRSG